MVSERRSLVAITSLLVMTISARFRSAGPIPTERRPCCRIRGYTPVGCFLGVRPHAIKSELLAPIRREHVEGCPEGVPAGMSKCLGAELHLPQNLKCHAGVPLKCHAGVTCRINRLGSLCHQLSCPGCDLVLGLPLLEMP